MLPCRYIRPAVASVPEGISQYWHQDRGTSRPQHECCIAIDVMISQDEVLIGKDHPTVLSVAAPKEVGNVSCQANSSVLLTSIRR
jgi:hypothetical protein